MNDLTNETQRLYYRLRELGWSLSDCSAYAPLTLEINELKKKKNAVILAHSYQTPDIVYGVADFTGDSFALAQEAAKTSASAIVFAGVRFMAETAKILNPGKTVLLPSHEAGCSLAESITAGDVRELKREHPGVPVVCYVNTSAEVKSESDACCTSSNALRIINALPGKEVIFIPDEFMAKNLAAQTSKRIISWKGKCVVHEAFNSSQLQAVRLAHPHAKILVHTECPPDVVRGADLAGGTSDMIKFVKNSDAREFMLVTECGLTDRLRVEVPGKKIVGTLCPYMKKITLRNIRQALASPTQEQVIEIPEDVRLKAKQALDKMFELSTVPASVPA